MSEDKNATEKYIVKHEEKWIAEEEITLETIQKAHLKISRILFDKESPPKRCMSFSKNRKSVAFDIEMVPIIVHYLIKLTPLNLVPKEFRTEQLDKIWDIVLKS